MAMTTTRKIELSAKSLWNPKMDHNKMLVVAKSTHHPCSAAGSSTSQSGIIHISYLQLSRIRSKTKVRDWIVVNLRFSHGWSRLLFEIKTDTERRRGPCVEAHFRRQFDKTSHESIGSCFQEDSSVLLKFELDRPEWSVAFPQVLYNDDEKIVFEMAKIRSGSLLLNRL